jgi:metal-responsive CopG/Arc/MetJ family transcriptional regulator
MRTLVDIPESDLSKLTKMSKAKKVSRAQLVRLAISEYLGKDKEDSLDKLAGIWADRNIDGLEYQLAMRREWDREL